MNHKHLKIGLAMLTVLGTATIAKADPCKAIPDRPHTDDFRSHPAL